MTIYKLFCEESMEHVWYVAVFYSDWKRIPPIISDSKVDEACCVAGIFPTEKNMIDMKFSLYV